MKKLFFLLFVGLISLDAFSGIVIYNRSTGGAGPNGYKDVKAFGVSVGNITSVTIDCYNPGNETCPETVDVGIANFEEQFDECEISYINGMISKVDSQISEGITDSSHTGHYYNTATNSDYYYQAIWYLDDVGNQITEIIKL